MSQIGSNIKKLRKVKGLSQQAFADVFKLSRGNISSYEELRAEPRISVILEIAKYFSIPVAVLLERQLTVNEILNFEDHFVEEVVKAGSENLTEIPFIGREAFQQGGSTATDLSLKPKIALPIYQQNQFIAVENCSFIPRPTAFPFEEHSILFFELVKVDILHTLDAHFGFYSSPDQVFFGQYVVNGMEIELHLNDWKKEIYRPDNKEWFWKLHSKFEKVL